MAYIDVDALRKIKFHPLPYQYVVPSDVDKESYVRGWNDVIDGIIETMPTADVVDKALYKRLLENSVIIAAALQSYQSADMVEVVRCKDCKHGIPTRIDTVTGEFSDERYCNRHHMCHFEDYYCADGKRKETDNE